MLNMPNGIFGNPVFQVTVGVFLFVLAISAINLFALPRHIFIGFQELRVYDWFFLESIFLILMGGMLLVGSGGLTSQTLKAAVDYSQTDESQASKIFRQSRFKATSFLRLGLILLSSGIIFLVLFLITGF